MKQLLISFICIFMMQYLYAQILSIPDKEYLTKRKFSDSYPLGGWTIEFYSNNNYKITYGSEGKYWHDQGNYELKNGKAYLSPTKCYDHEKGPEIDCKRSMGEGVCYIEESSKSIYYSKFLTCKSNDNKYLMDESKKDDIISFPIMDSKLVEGSKNIIKTIPVIMVGLKKGITTSNVKIREKPSLNSKIISYQKGLFAEEAKQLAYVPANVEVLVIARSEKKEKIENWENYWYYVDVGVIYGVWMFGEFIKFK